MLLGGTTFVLGLTSAAKRNVTYFLLGHGGEKRGFLVVQVDLGGVAFF